MPTKPTNVRSRSALSVALATWPGRQREDAQTRALRARRSAPSSRRACRPRRVAASPSAVRTRVQRSSTRPRRALHVRHRGLGRRDGTTPSASARSRTGTQPDGGRSASERAPDRCRRLPGAQHRRIRRDRAAHRASPRAACGRLARTAAAMRCAIDGCPVGCARCGERRLADRRSPSHATHSATTVISPEVSVPGLVRADDRRRAERLDGGQAADERVAAGHAAHVRPRARSWPRPAGLPGTAATASAIPVSSMIASGAPCRTPSAPTSAGDGQRHPDQAVTERVESPLERRALLADTADQQSDPAELGQPCPLRSTTRPCGAGGHGRALVDHVACDRRAACRTARTASTSFDTGSDSPVSAASSVREIGRDRRGGHRRAPSVPASSSTTSPGTSSRASTLCARPSRSTNARMTSESRAAPPWRGARAAPSRSRARH